MDNIIFHFLLANDTIGIVTAKLEFFMNHQVAKNVLWTGLCAFVNALCCSPEEFRNKDFCELVESENTDYLNCLE